MYKLTESVPKLPGTLTVGKAQEKQFFGSHSMGGMAKITTHATYPDFPPTSGFPSPGKFVPSALPTIGFPQYRRNGM